MLMLPFPGEKNESNNERKNTANDERLNNIRKAEEIAKQLWDAGFAVICPHSNGTMLDGVPYSGGTDRGEKMLMRGDLEMIKWCDFIVVVDGWAKSKGSQREIDFALNNGITIFSSIENAVNFGFAIHDFSNQN